MFCSVPKLRSERLLPKTKRSYHAIENGIISILNSVSDPPSRRFLEHYNSCRGASIGDCGRTCLYRVSQVAEMAVMEQSVVRSLPTNHPNIVLFHDAGISKTETEVRYYILSEYCPSNVLRKMSGAQVRRDFEKDECIDWSGTGERGGKGTPLRVPPA